MVEIWILTLVATATMMAMVGIIWIFTVHEDVIENFHLSFLDYFGEGPNADGKTRQLYVRYRRAIRAGKSVDDEEFSKLPNYMRNDRLRRRLYLVMGVFYATSIGVAGGFVLYVLLSN